MGASKELSREMRECTVNMTFKIQRGFLVPFEKELRSDRIPINVIDYRVVPNTEYLYENDETFRKLVKKESNARKEKQNYINEKNK